MTKPAITKRRTKLTPGPTRADLTGRTFGFLRVLRLDRIEGRHGYWLCQCLRATPPNGKPCGTRKPIRDNKLTGGVTVSCGCSRADPEVRRSASAKIPARLRKQIAQEANAARRKMQR